MRLVTIVAVAGLVAVTGCSKSSSSGSASTESTKSAESAKGEIGSWKEIPNIDGFVADVPAGAEANGIGGAAGFHTKDDSFGFTLREISGDEAAKDMNAAKKDAEELLFKKWVASEKTADGFALQWEGSKIDDQGNPKGSIYMFQVRRTLDGKTYTCDGSVASQAALANAVKSCKTLKKA